MGWVNYTFFAGREGLALNERSNPLCAYPKEYSSMGPIIFKSVQKKQISYDV